MEPYQPELEVHKKFAELVAALKACKPNDRSEFDRKCQILLTDLEKAQAYWIANTLPWACVYTLVDQTRGGESKSDSKWVEDWMKVAVPHT